jgi:hypothetical protein
VKIGTFLQKFEKLKPEKRRVKVGTCRQKLEKFCAENKK